jgi:hypothetical protein
LRQTRLLLRNARNFQQALETRSAELDAGKGPAARLAPEERDAARRYLEVQLRVAASRQNLTSQLLQRQEAVTQLVAMGLGEGHPALAEGLKQVSILKQKLSELQ